MSKKLKAPKVAIIFYTLGGALFVLIFYVLRSFGGLDWNTSEGPASWISDTAHSYPRREDWAWYAFLAIPAFMLVGFIVHVVHEESVQSARNRTARIIEEKVRTGQYEGRYFLYLRPFSSTGAIKVGNPEKDHTPAFFLPFNWHVSWRLELEQVFSDALASKGPLIALGSPGEHFGAGRLPVEEQVWQETVKNLARNAQGILVLPSHHPGTRWEIAWLRENNLLEKTVFIMPPAESKKRRARQWDHWLASASTLQKVGVFLPEYAPTGLLFAVRNDGLVADTAPLDLASEEGLRNAFLHLLAALKSTVRYPRSPVIHLSPE